MPKYSEWWIGLVDYIGVLNPYDLAQFYEMPKLQTNFDRILIVSPFYPSEYVFLYE